MCVIVKELVSSQRPGNAHTQEKRESFSSENITKRRKYRKKKSDEAEKTVSLDLYAVCFLFLSLLLAEWDDVGKVKVDVLLFCCFHIIS